MCRLAIGSSPFPMAFSIKNMLSGTGQEKKLLLEMRDEDDVPIRIRYVATK